MDGADMTADELLMSAREADDPESRAMALLLTLSPAERARVARRLYDYHRDRDVRGAVAADALTGCLPERESTRHPVGTAVTVRPQLLPRDWTAEALKARERVPLRAGEATGTIVVVHDSHGLCYGVRFANGEVASYDPNEVVPAAGESAR